MNIGCLARRAKDRLHEGATRQLGVHVSHFNRSDSDACQIHVRAYNLARFPTADQEAGAFNNIIMVSIRSHGDYRGVLAWVRVKHTREADRGYAGTLSHSEERARSAKADPHTWSLSSFSKVQSSRSVIPTNQGETDGRLKALGWAGWFTAFIASPPRPVGVGSAMVHGGRDGRKSNGMYSHRGVFWLRDDHVCHRLPQVSTLITISSNFGTRPGHRAALARDRKRPVWQTSDMDMQ